MDFIIVLLLIIINGIFAMTEIAVISARKSKLQQQINEGSRRAKAALDLANNPNRFLSTVQVGITLVGIFAGAFGGATIAEGISKNLSSAPLIGMYSDAVGLGVVVLLITFLSLVIGELVPKRIALSSPEKIAKTMAGPMNAISKIVSPAVKVLSFSTDVVVNFLGIKQNVEPPVTDEEIKMLFKEGARVGVFEIAEKDIVERTLRLGDKTVNSLMTARSEISWINQDSSFAKIREKITKESHSHFPVCIGNLDKVIGIVRTEELLVDFLGEEKIDLKKLLHKPLFIPESMNGLKVLELFRKSGVHMALVIDEYGSVQGLVSLTDILEAIVGDIPTREELEEEIVKRDDGSFLVDGLVSVDDFKDKFKIRKLSGEKEGLFHTVGGYAMHRFGRIPEVGDHFQQADFKFEIVDMDGNRIDKILVTPLNKTS